jgi:hypothetical protein
LTSVSSASRSAAALAAAISARSSASGSAGGTDGMILAAIRIPRTASSASQKVKLSAERSAERIRLSMGRPPRWLPHPHRQTCKSQTDALDADK